MPVSLPPEIKELMTVPVMWEAFQGFDGHAEPSYAPAIQLFCWEEAAGSMVKGLEVYRRSDGTVVEPVMELYFNGDDPRARKMKLYDRFLPTGVGIDVNQKLQAVRVLTQFGPNFDNRHPWLVVVTL